MTEITIEYPPYLEYVKEIDRKTGEWLQLYEIVHPHIIMKGGYKTAISWSYFFHGVKKRNWSPNRLFYHVHSLDNEMDMDDYLFKVTGKYLFRNLPIVKVGSLWEFYELVGYDYKRQKWAKI